MIEECWHCWFCGRLLEGRRKYTNFCNAAHYIAQWRAVKMLEGTHGYVNYRFVRLEQAAAA